MYAMLKSDPLYEDLMSLDLDPVTMIELDKFKEVPHMPVHDECWYKKAIDQTIKLDDGNKVIGVTGTVEGTESSGEKWKISLRVIMRGVDKHGIIRTSFYYPFYPTLEKLDKLTLAFPQYLNFIDFFEEYTDWKVTLHDKYQYYEEDMIMTFLWAWAELYNKSLKDGIMNGIKQT